MSGRSHCWVDSSTWFVDVIARRCCSVRPSGNDSTACLCAIPCQRIVQRILDLKAEGTQLAGQHCLAQQVAARPCLTETVVPGHVADVSRPSIAAFCTPGEFRAEVLPVTS